MLTCNMKDIMNEANDPYYKSIVSAAIMRGGTQIFNYLMQYEMFPNIDLSCIEGAQHDTALIFACWYRKTKIAQLLLNHPNMTKKIINMTDTDGCTAFYYVCERDVIDIVKIMINDERVDVNIADYHGKTPLIASIYREHIDIALLLIKHADQCNIDLNATFRGKTAIDTAIDLADRHRGSRQIKIKRLVDALREVSCK